jgi:hypothetical protein
LLVDAGDGVHYLFAHRSIQEFLAAERLRLIGDRDFVLERAADAEWRQVIQFYAVGLEQDQANAFLPSLAERNPELAGYCLSGAAPSDAVARVVLDHLEPVDDVRIGALAAATLSPRVPVQDLAIDRLSRVLADPESPLRAISGDVDALLPLLNSLAGTNAADIAGLVPAIIARVPDDPRLVDPLWRCLAAPGIEALEASRAIIGRLLSLATSSDGFAELARQDPYTRDFLGTDLRHRAYPFASGLPMDHNLVTLLAWAEYKDVVPESPNRYFEAKVSGDLPRIESARRHTVTISPYRFMLIFDVVLAVAAVVAASVVGYGAPEILLKPFGWWMLPLFLGVGIASISIWLISGLAGPLKEQADRPVSKSPHVAEIFGNWLDNSTFKAPVVLEVIAIIILIVVVPVSIMIAAVPLIAHSWTLYLIVSIVAGYLYWLPHSQVFYAGQRYYVYRPSKYIDVYGDSRSRHWVVATPDTKPRRTATALRPGSEAA